MSSSPLSTKRVGPRSVVTLQVLGVEKLDTDSMRCTWSVTTDRGPTRFVLKGEEDIRRLGKGALLIASAEGINFRIADQLALDRHSRRLLERFL